MASNERTFLPDQMWFDPGNPGPMHDALRDDYARTKVAIARRPSLRRHFAECPTCQAIEAAMMGAAAPHAGRRRLKLRIDLPSMHRMLGLPPNFEIVHMFADDDPNIVWIMVAGEGLPEVDPAAEAPQISPEAVAQRTPPTAS